jgi:hypothetical protein
MSSLVNNATSSMQCNTHTHTHTHTQLPHCACQKHNNCLSMCGEKTYTKCSHLIVRKTLKNHLSTRARKKKPTPNAPCWKITKRAPCKVAISPQARAATSLWNYLELLYKNKKLKMPTKVQLSAKLVWAWFKWHTNEFLFSLDLCVKNPCRLGHLSPLPKNTGWVIVCFQNFEQKSSRPLSSSSLIFSSLLVCFEWLKTWWVHQLEL